ncbi:ABC transporter permease [Cohnella sp. GCM10020058]|uniref:ABC transporter permease n=1 Tax=Cohnella sp. GCM10020058 TaxID=3317330 RepID=UPI0036284C2F
MSRANAQAADRSGGYVHKASLRSKIWRYRWLYVFMIPGILYYLIYHYVPMFGLVVAFQDYNLMKGVTGSAWVGWDNFKAVFESPDFPQLMKNTVLLSLYRLVFGMLPDLLLALMLNEIRVRWFKKTIQTLTYGPHFLSWIIVYGIMFSFFAPGSGLVTTFFRDMGWGDIDALTNSGLFRPMLVMTDIWKSTGYGAIIYLAALANINHEQYEAAAIDGANRWSQLWHVTLPGVRDVFMLLVILRLGGILDAGFEQVYIFLNVRVYDVGDILDTWIFRRGIEEMNYSVPAAVGVFKSVIGFVLVLGANKLAKRFGGSGIW